MVAYLQACVAIMASDHKSPKLAELCGQIYMAKRFFDDAHDALGWAWQNAKGTTRASTAACLLTLYRKENDMTGLREFAESEVIPVLGGYDDPLAQETCARAYLYLEESKQALRYLRAH